MPGRAGPGRVGPGRVATETEIRNEPPSKRAQEKNTPFGQTPHSDEMCIRFSRVAYHLCQEVRVLMSNLDKLVKIQ